MTLRLNIADYRVLLPIAEGMGGQAFRAWLEAQYREASDALVQADSPELRGAAQALNQLRQGLDDAREEVLADRLPPPPMAAD